MKKNANQCKTRKRTVTAGAISSRMPIKPNSNKKINTKTVSNKK